MGSIWARLSFFPDDQHDRNDFGEPGKQRIQQGFDHTSGVRFMEKMTPIAFEGCRKRWGTPPRIRLIDLSSLLCLLTIVGLSACVVSKPGEVPQEIMGTWETSAVGYEDCYFEITRSRVVFTNPITKPSVNVIREIGRSSEGKCTVYEITYEDEQKLDYKFSLYYCRAESEETIFFKDMRKVIWKRKFVPGEPAFSSNDPRVWSKLFAAGWNQGKDLCPCEHGHPAFGRVPIFRTSIGRGHERVSDPRLDFLGEHAI